MKHRDISRRQKAAISVVAGVLLILLVTNKVTNKSLFFSGDGITCRTDKPLRLGSYHNGWWVCEPIGRSLKNAVVYSVGIGKDISWDEEMIARFQTQQHGWDPTPTAKEFMKTKQDLQGFTYHEFGLGSSDGNVDVVLPNDNGATVSYRVTEQEQEGWSRITIPVLSLDSMMKMNGHDHLDILKFDIEGAEFDMIEKWAAEDINVRADQLLIEFHERFFDNSEQVLEKAFANLKKLGFQLFHATSQEYVFIKGTLKYSFFF